jgi:hypothetical protein
LEQSLGNDPPVYTPGQIAVLGKELSAALLEFEPLLAESEKAKPEAVQMDGDKLEALLSELRPLLEKGDFGAASFAEKLQAAAGMEELAGLIDDYNFEDALKKLDQIIRELNIIKI